MGLIKAIDKFDPSFQVKFSTYAVPMIIGEIRRYLRDNNSITGTFLMNELLGPKERVRIEEGNIFTLGATTLILRGANSNDTSCED